MISNTTSKKILHTLLPLHRLEFIKKSIGNKLQSQASVQEPEFDRRWQWLSDSVDAMYPEIPVQSGEFSQFTTDVEMENDARLNRVALLM